MESEEAPTRLGISGLGPNGGTSVSKWAYSRFRIRLVIRDREGCLSTCFRKIWILVSHRLSFQSSKRVCVEIRIRVLGNTGAVPPTYDIRAIRYRKHGLWGVAPTILGFWGRRRGERSATRLRKNVSLFDEFRDMSTSTFACTQIVGLALGHGRGVF